MLRFLGPIRSLAVLLLCPLGLPVHAQRHEGKRVERTEILSLEEKWREAQLTEDTSAMDKLLSEQFLGVTAAGQVVTKTQQLDRMRTRSLDIKRLDLSDTKIKISGGLAVVTSLAEIDGTAEGTPLQGAFRYTRVYQKVPGDGWKITNFEATHVGQLRSPLRVPQVSSPRPAAAVSSSHLASPEESVFRLPPS